MIDEYNSTKAKSMSTYCGYAPNKIVRGKGVKLIDERGDEYTDFGMALGSVFLGYAYDEVDEYVISHIRNGVNYSRPSSLEEHLSKVLERDIGSGKGIRYAKSSSILLNIIPRVCRYLSGRELIAYPKGCYLGNCDWYLSRCYNSGGILEDVKSKTINFEKGDIESVSNLFSVYGSRLSCIIMEPYREEIYDPAFYRLLKEKCDEYSVLLVYDETVTGFRYHYPLAQYKVCSEADTTVVGKAISNGYALAGVIADKGIFDQIDMAYTKGQLFDFSITHAGESIGLAAASKTIEIISREGVVNYVNDLGQYFIVNMNNIIDQHSLSNELVIKGQPSYFQISSPRGYLDNKTKADILKFCYENNILSRGIFSICYEHTKEDIDKFLSIFDHYCKEVSHRRLLLKTSL